MKENLYTEANKISFGETPVHGPVPETMVAAAEETLDVKFPPSYRNFLLHLGAVGDIAGLFFPPSPDDEFSFLDVVYLSKAMWSNPDTVEASRRLIYLDSNGGDLKYFLDPSQADKSRECPVVIHGPGSDFVPFAKDFFEFVRMTYGTD